MKVNLFLWNGRGGINGKQFIQKKGLTTRKTTAGGRKGMDNPGWSARDIPQKVSRPVEFADMERCKGMEIEYPEKGNDPRVQSVWL